MELFKSGTRKTSECIVELYLHSLLYAQNPWRNK